MANKKFELAYPDLGTATTYAGELALPYLGAATSANSIDDGLVTRLDGIRNKAVVSTLSSTDPVVAALCATTPGDSLELGESVLTMTDCMVSESLCRKTLWPTWVAHQMNNSRNSEPSDFIDFAMSYVAAKAADQVERFIWQGSAIMGVGLVGEDGTTLDNTHFKASKIGASWATQWTQLQSGTALSSTNIGNALLDVYNKAASACPGILNAADLQFVLSPADYAKYLVFLGTQGAGYNMQVTSQDFNSVTYLGIPVRRAMGMLDGVIVLSPASNLFVGSNLGTDMSEAQVIPRYKYDGSDFIQLIMRFGIGVQVGIGTNLAVGTTIAIS